MLVEVHAPTVPNTVQTGSNSLGSCMNHIFFLST